MKLDDEQTDLLYNPLTATSDESDRPVVTYSRKQKVIDFTSDALNSLSTASTLTNTLRTVLDLVSVKSREDSVYDVESTTVDLIAIAALAIAILAMMHLHCKKCCTAGLIEPVKSLKFIEQDQKRHAGKRATGMAILAVVPNLIKFACQQLGADKVVDALNTVYGQVAQAAGPMLVYGADRLFSGYRARKAQRLSGVQVTLLDRQGSATIQVNDGPAVRGFSYGGIPKT